MPVGNRRILIAVVGAIAVAGVLWRAIGHARPTSRSARYLLVARGPDGGVGLVLNDGGTQDVVYVGMAPSILECRMTPPPDGGLWIPCGQGPVADIVCMPTGNCNPPNIPDGDAPHSGRALRIKFQPDHAVPGGRGVHLTIAPQ